MPQPLPWFDNDIDSTLPSQIKAENYRYDEYGTYDVLVADRIGIYIELNANFVFKFIDYKIVALIDRFVPWDYPWAKDYSSKAYQFIKNFTGTDYYWSSLACRDKFNFDFGSQIYTINLDSYQVDTSVNLEIPAASNREYICITWLEREGLDEDGTYYEENEFIKRYKLFHTLDKPQTININFGTLLYCSVVIGGSANTISTVEAQLIAKSKGYLYQGLDELLQFVTQAIETSYPRLYLLLKQLFYKLKITWGASTEFYSLQFPQYTYPAPDTSFESQWLSATFVTRPEYYRACSLFYANNNYWSNGLILNDLGYSTYFYSDRFDFFVFREDRTNSNFKEYLIEHNIVQLKNQPLADYFETINSTDITPPKYHFYKNLIPIVLNNSNYTPDTIAFPSGENFIYNADTSISAGYRKSHFATAVFSGGIGGFMNYELGRSIASPPKVIDYYPGLLRRSYGKKYIITGISLEGYFEDPIDQKSDYKIRYRKHYLELETCAESYNFNSSVPYKTIQNYDKILGVISSNESFEYSEVSEVEGVIDFDYYNSYQDILQLEPTINSVNEISPQAYIDYIDQRNYYLEEDA